MPAEKELIVAPPQENALAIYNAEKGLEPWLQKIRAKVDEFLTIVPDLKTVKGRKAITSMAYDIARTKTGLEEAGKAISAEQKKVSGRIDAERKRVWDTLELWQKEVRKPLDDWQAKEDSRVDYHNRMIRHIEDCGIGLIGGQPQPFAILFRELEEKIIVDEKFEEFEAEAHRAKASALAKLKASFDEHQKREAEQAELVRLRAETEAQAQRERDAQIVREAEERARREAEQRAQAERDAAVRREQALIDQAAQAKRDADQKAREAEAAAANQALQLKLAAEQAEHQKLQAEADRVESIRRAEQDRIAAEQRQAAAVEQARLAEVARANAAADEINRQAAAREADKAHKGAIYKAAKEAFIVSGMSEECARLAVKVIASGFIPAISIQY